MSDMIEFKDNGEFIEVYSESDKPPFNDILLGAIRKNEDGYYVFHVARKVILYVCHLRRLAAHISELNINQATRANDKGE